MPTKFKQALNKTTNIMNMNNPLENLRQLTEAVPHGRRGYRYPPYIEYVQLAFAIANDCRGSGTQ